MSITKPARNGGTGLRWTGWAIGLLGAAPLASGSDLLQFFLPVPTIAVCGFAAAAACFAASWIQSGMNSRASRFSFALAMLGVALLVLRPGKSFDTRDVTFESQGATLAGTLYLPAEDGLHAALVIAQGSIKAPRRMYALFAEHLVEAGFAVLSFDKRGTGASGGDYEAENNSSWDNLNLLASDVAAGAEALSRERGVDPSRIGVFGLSMGGWLGPLAATKTNRISFMALNSGPAVSVGEEAYYSQLTGELHADAQALSRDEIERRVNVREPSGYDPRPILRSIDVPTLWIFGELDSSVPTAKSIAVLDSLRGGHAAPFSIHVLEGAEHLGFVMRWPFDLHPDFWDVTLEWLSAPTRGR